MTNYETPLRAGGMPDDPFDPWERDLLEAARGDTPHLDSADLVNPKSLEVRKHLVFVSSIPEARERENLDLYGEDLTRVLLAYEDARRELEICFQSDPEYSKVRAFQSTYLKIIWQCGERCELVGLESHAVRGNRLTAAGNATISATRKTIDLMALEDAFECLSDIGDFKEENNNGISITSASLELLFALHTSIDAWQKEHIVDQTKASPYL